jgi:hypothetical protein
MMHSRMARSIDNLHGSKNSLQGRKIPKEISKSSTSINTNDDRNKRRMSRGPESRPRQSIAPPPQRNSNANDIKDSVESPLQPLPPKPSSTATDPGSRRKSSLTRENDILVLYKSMANKGTKVQTTAEENEEEVADANDGGTQ